MKRCHGVQSRATYLAVATGIHAAMRDTNNDVFFFYNIGTQSVGCCKLASNWYEGSRPAYSTIPTPGSSALVDGGGNKTNQKDKIYTFTGKQYTIMVQNNWSSSHPYLHWTNTGSATMKTLFKSLAGDGSPWHIDELMERDLINIL